MLDFATILTLALPLFLIMDPIGNATFCIAILRGQTPARQRAIIWRELLIALGIIVTFQFLGDGLLSLLAIDPSTLRVAGGVILFIISLRMVFPSGNEQAEAMEDPFIVPIAVPFIAGPSLLAAVMLYAHREPSQLTLFLAVLLAWTVSAGIMMCAPWLTKLLGKRGLVAAERLMGLILVFLSVQMLEDGIRLFLETL